MSSFVKLHSYFCVFKNACRRKVSGTEKEVTTEIIARESQDCRNVTSVKNSNEAVTVGTRGQKFEYGRMSPKSISFINLLRGSRQHSHAQLLDILTCLTFIRGSSLKTTLLFRGKFSLSLYLHSKQNHLATCRITIIIHLIIFHSKYFAVSDWSGFNPPLILHNELALTIFEKCELLMVYLIQNEAAWAKEKWRSLSFEDEIAGLLT